jgi:L-2-hydroxyglutarate oxidase
VIHSGIYYAPGSLKAKLCRVGANATKQFCIDNGIPFKACGKLLVATNTLELERLSALEERAHKNGIVCKRLDVPNLRVAEPEVQGLGALLVPEAGIVNYRLVALAMARRIRELGGEIRLGFPVASIEETAHGVTIASGKDTLTADRLIACAGLQSPPNSAPSWTYYRTRNYTFQG